MDDACVWVYAKELRVSTLVLQNDIIDLDEKKLSCHVNKYN